MQLGTNEWARGSICVRGTTLPFLRQVRVDPLLSAGKPCSVKAIPLINLLNDLAQFINHFLAVQW